MHESNPVKRSQKLFRYFGWSGGTIHQIARETGVDVADLLYTEPSAINQDDCQRARFSQGCLAAETCSPPYRLSLVPKVRGSRAFWVGVACSIDLEDSTLSV